ncbi:hypothetical protein [Dermacoccus nishinomiyaensis]|uniref:hypothetical protein n=1 Tax=Dermacoccus nishinomiyaensis TaxID=1274 RepID=UPI00119EA38F|nr:hypothetical protein [Dermacoccus nishinomiyaensis]
MDFVDEMLGGEREEDGVGEGKVVEEEEWVRGVVEVGKGKNVWEGEVGEGMGIWERGVGGMEGGKGEVQV